MNKFKEFLNDVLGDFIYIERLPDVLACAIIGVLGSVTLLLYAANNNGQVDTIAYIAVGCLTWIPVVLVLSKYWF